MWNALTCSRSPDLHRANMLRLVILAGLLCLLWEPIRPVRTLTAQVLHSTADAIAR